MAHTPFCGAPVLEQVILPAPGSERRFTLAAGVSQPIGFRLPKGGALIVSAEYPATVGVTYEDGLTGVFCVKSGSQRIVMAEAIVGIAPVSIVANFLAIWPDADATARECDE